MQNYGDENQNEYTAPKEVHRSHKGSEYTDLSVRLKCSLFDYIYALNPNTAQI